MQSARHENMRSESRRRPAISRDAGIALRGGGRASRGAGKDLRAGPASRSTSPNPHSASSDLRGADPNPRSASRTSHGKDPASHILDLKNAASTAGGTHHLLVLDIDDPASGGPLLTVPEAQALSDLLRMAKAAREKPRSLAAPHILLAAASSYSTHEVVRAFSQAGLPSPRVILLDAYENPAVLAQADATTKLAQASLASGSRLQDAIVIAATPYDLPLLSEAGTAYALEGAGSACRAAADFTFPARRKGGLAQALAHLCRNLFSNESDYGGIVHFHPLDAAEHRT